MKKFLLITAGIIFVLLIITFIIALFISFKLVKRTTDNINADLKDKLGVVVRIPKESRPTYKDFTTTIYTWEMETNQNEVTTVIFKHDTGFLRAQNKIKATLQMDQAGDPSLFNKVLPAVIADKQSLASAQNLEHPNLDANPDVGYGKLQLYAYKGNSQQVSEIDWEFNRDIIGKNSLKFYDKLNKYPEWLIEGLYWLQRTTLTLLDP